MRRGEKKRRRGEKKRKKGGKDEWLGEGRSDGVGKHTWSLGGAR